MRPAIAAWPATLLVLALGVAGCAGQPLGERTLTGDYFTHDPALVAGTGAGERNGDWFVYSTGDGQVADGNIQVRHSDDGEHWEYAGEVWQEKPEWLTEAVPGVANLWAPELYEHDGTWYLYYSASTFGSNTSVIGLATNTTLDPDDPAYQWVDQGEVIASEGENFNAIDPGIVEDEDGTPWMSFGSFWGGLQLVELQWPSGMLADAAAEPVTIADRQTPPNAIEAPYLMARDGYYYLFVSKDFCCKGLESTYNMAVGRSADIEGPYVDRDGVPMLEDGGTPLLASEGSRVGPGGQSVSGDLLAFHYYDETLDGAFRLGLVPLHWDDGWPTARWE